MQLPGLAYDAFESLGTSHYPCLPLVGPVWDKGHCSPIRDQSQLLHEGTTRPLRAGGPPHPSPHDAPDPARYEIIRQVAKGAVMLKIIKRVLVVLPAVVVEALVIYLLVTWISPWTAWIEGALRVVGSLLILFVISYRQEGAYKILWILFLTALPAPAAVMYLLYGNRRSARLLERRMRAAHDRLALPGADGSSALAAVRAQDGRVADTLRYVTKLSGSSAMVNESADYYALGEDGWTVMLDELRAAEHYIYLEYFIVEDGLMWGEMLKVMAEKAGRGVDVRLMYDDLGSISTFDRGDTRRLDEAGIKWLAFNPLRFVSGTLNNRNHRKMLVIDGRVAFSGGINLADEYINKVVRFGHWKDIAFRVTGPSVGSYVHMFAEFWNAFSKDQVPASAFVLVPREPMTKDGVILSYHDSPFNRDPISETLYIEMLGNVRHHAWFYTPYLMLGDTLLDAFVRAAERGVDVRIMVPGIPDKRLVYRLSKSYFRPLLAAGVRIYTYTPGFLHAKATLFDDEVCTIGSVNLDYRGLYLHFENNSVFWRASILKALKADFEATLERCAEVTEADLNRHLLPAIFDGVLRIFAPLC